MKVSVLAKYGSAMLGMAIRKWCVRLIEDMRGNTRPTLGSHFMEAVRAAPATKIYSLDHLEIFLARAAHSGQVQFTGTSSQRVPGVMPSSGTPVASSYT